MALTNFDIITIVNTVMNKDLEGQSIKSSEFQTLINAQSKLLFDEMLGLPNRYQLNAPIARRGAGISRKNSQELRPFYVTQTLPVVGGVGDLSTLSGKLAYLLAVNPSTITGRGFDELEPDEIADRMGDEIVAPTIDDPVFTWRDSDSILVYPSIISSINVIYYKEPIDAVVATTNNAVTLLEEYDSVNSTELEWADSQKVELAYRILRDAGINIERNDVVAYAQNITSNE